MALGTITTDDGFTISSNAETDEELTAALAKPPEAAASADDRETPRGEAAAVSTDSGSVETAAPVAEKKPDGRTREGRKQSIQAEIDDLTNRRAKTQQEFDDTQARLAQARADLAALDARRTGASGDASRTATSRSDGAATARTPASDDPEPEFEQFLNEPDAATAYHRALARWEGRQESRRQFQAESAARQEHERMQAFVAETTAKQRTALQKIADAAKTNPTLIETISPLYEKLQPAAYWVLQGKPEQITGATVIADCILDSDNPDALLLRLSEDSAEFDRIASLPVHLAHREMGRLEGALTAAVAAQRPKPIVASAAPPPTKPLGGAPVVRASQEPPGDDASDAEHDAYWKKYRKAVR